MSFVHESVFARLKLYPKRQRTSTFAKATADKRVLPDAIAPVRARVRQSLFPRQFHLLAGHEVVEKIPDFPVFEAIE